MEHKTRTKALSWLLSLAMALSLLPGLSLTALADDNNPYASLVPEDNDTKAELLNKRVTFNGKKWYVIKNDSTAKNVGTLTLLYAGSLGDAPFDTDGKNIYANSSIKTALGNLTAENGRYYPVAEAINGELYLLSEEEANNVPWNVRKDFPSGAWWLRTQGDDTNTVKYVFVNDTVQNNPGRIVNSGIAPTTSGVGVRPALQLVLSKVEFDTDSKTFAIPAIAPTDVTVTGATLVEDYKAGKVSVTATAADGHTLSYQWYQSTTNSNQDGKKIDGATSATYDIPIGKTEGNYYYYYCVVTATRTDNNQTASVTSGVAVVTVAANTDALVEKLAEEKDIVLSNYYLIPAEDMYFTSNEYWNKNSSWEKLPDGDGENHVATKQFTIQGLPKGSLVFCKAYYVFDAVAWGGDKGKIETIGKRYNLLTKISDQFDWWDTYSLFGFNLTKYAEGDFNTKEEANLPSISDAFRIYVPKPADAAKVKGTAYPTVADAIRAAGEGDTVKLLRDVTENVVLRAGTNIVLDLNGHKLTNDGRHCTIVAQNGSTLVVTGNGTVDNTTHGCAPLYNNGGTVTLNGGTFTRSAEAGKDNNSYYTVVNRGTMTINEGVTVSNDNPKYNYSSLIANGYYGLTQNGYREIDPKVSNGYVESESAANPTLTINGGTFKGGNQALKNDVNGIATISGGDFSSTTGNAIKNLGELTISGGTFTAEAEGKFALLSAAESDETYSANGTATVTGGTFNGKLQKDEGATIAISGGQFSEIVPKDCCAEGYEPSNATNNNNRYTVIPQGGAVVNVAIVGVVAEGVKTAVTVVPAVQGATYKWFRDDGTTAISDKKDYVPTAEDVGKKLTLKVYDAEDNEIGSVVYGDDEGEKVKSFGDYFAEQLTNDSELTTIKLDGPVSGGITIPAGKKITLDLNGQTVTGGVDIDEGANLTIKPEGTITGDIRNSGTLTINGGAFQGDVTSIGNGKTTIKGGQFDNKPTASTPGTVSIEGGKFKANPTEANDGVTTVSGKQVVEVNETYSYQVTDKPDTSATVKVDQGKTTYTVANTIASENQDAAISVARNTTVDLKEAAVEHVRQIVASSDRVNDSDKNIVIVPALKVEAEAYTEDDDNPTLRLDIQATYTSYETDKSITDADKIKTAAVGQVREIGSGKLDTTGTAIDVKIKVPDAFATALGTTAFVQHTHDSKHYEYPANIRKSGNDYFVEFTNPNGFSPFTLSKTSASVVTAMVNGENRYYTDLWSALNDIPNGTTLTLTENNMDLTAVINSAKVVTIAKGKPEIDLNKLNITAGSGLDISKTDNDDGTVTFTTTSRSSGGSSRSSGSSGTTYAPTVSKSSNGTVSIRPTSPKSGDKVTITVKPGTGYAVDTVTVTDASGKAVAVTKNTDGTYTFTQPNSKVTVDATFTEVVANNGLSKYYDVDANAWYADAVRWVTEEGVMNGVSPHMFNPNDNTSRAMVAMLLWRMDGSPVDSDEMKFVDVADGVWYTEAIRWAASTGIITGSKIPAETTPWPKGFRPDDAVTREQLASMLYRYAQYKGVDVSVGEDTNILSYDDATGISEYAVPAVQWAVGSGILNGTTNGTREVVLGPGGAATRAQVATMLMRYSTAK